MGLNPFFYYFNVNGDVMKSEHVLVASGFMGILMFWLLPSWYKVFAFLIPALAISMVYYEKFNWTVFLTLTLLFVLFPSSLFTQDASEPFNIVATRNYYNNVVSSVMSVVCIVIPIIGILAGIYALILGNAESGTNQLIKGIATIILVGIFLFFASMFGWKVFGLAYMKGIFEWFWDLIKKVVNFFADTIGTLLDEEDQEHLKLVEDKELLDVAGTPKAISLTIASFYPLIISIIAMIIPLIHYALKTPIKKQKIPDSQRFNRPNSRDFSFVVFLIIILTMAFILYLTYTFESFLNYQTIGFFSIYLIITSVTCILLFMGIGSPTKLSKDSFYGTIVCVALLFLYANMFSQTQTLDLLHTEFPDLSIAKILNQFLFVSPTESCLFHVFLPSMVIYYYLQKNRVLTEEEVKLRIIKLQNEMETIQITAEIHKDMKQTEKYVKNMRLINKNKNEIEKLRITKNEIPITKLKDRDFVIYLIFVVIFNILFSILHWFKSGLTFEVFWSSGMGFLYMSSGIILTLIAYRYGWLSAILAHAIHNSLTLFLILLLTGA